ncbi:hypothetical protein HYT02_03760 [Candidatus Gottesmanbacteria bacterium]|nr:hypothetical protein [Candidatus Gottesmanbacteria bacterium]
MSWVKKKRVLKIILLVILLGFPIYFPLKMLAAGAIPHWHDTAWGLLLGLENLQKIRLIGYEGGIPGIFYGPHWSWLVALVQIFNKDPIVIAFFVLVLPYFILVPYLLYRFKPIFGGLSVIILWLLYILAYYPNTVHLWHVNLAPIIFLGIFCSVVAINWDKEFKRNLISFFVLGILSGLLTQLHMSFGSIIFIGVVTYLLLNIFIFFNKKRKLKIFFTNLVYIFLPFLIGVSTASLPFILFELRHGFGQTKRIIYVLTQSFLYNSAVVGQVGLSDIQILEQFFLLPKNLFQVPGQLAYLWIFIVVFLVLYGFLTNKFSWTKAEKQLISFIVICSGMLLFVFLSSKNPIWNYQFIGAEIIFLLLTGVIISKFPFFKVLLFIWVIYLSVATIHRSFNEPKIDPLTIQTLYTKKYILDFIYKDAQGKPFSVFVYAPSIYTFDYDYLFKWLGEDKYHYIPQENQNITYLIIPDASTLIREDFINYKTPDSEFKTSNSWEIGGQTLIVKREKLSFN